jgi:hypothetical protein
MSDDRTAAIERVAISVHASEETDDVYVEVPTADARALLDERRDLAQKLAVATLAVARVASQRDATESALNEANAELHRITRCGETTTGLLGDALRPCYREAGHPGGHRNTDGTEWRERDPDPLEASDAWSRAQADDEQAAQQVEADLRAARDMLRKPVEPLRVRVTQGILREDAPRDAYWCTSPNHARREHHPTITLYGGPWCLKDGEYEIVTEDGPDA